jgi:hypothetical protein
LAEGFLHRLRNWGRQIRKLLAEERVWVPESLATELLHGIREMERLQQQVPVEEFAVVHLSKDELRSWLDNVADRGARRFVIDPHDGLVEEQDQASLDRLRAILAEGDKK